MCVRENTHSTFVGYFSGFIKAREIRSRYTSAVRKRYCHMQRTCACVHMSIFVWFSMCVINARGGSIAPASRQKLSSIQVIFRPAAYITHTTRTSSCGKTLVFASGRGTSAPASMRIFSHSCTSFGVLQPPPVHKLRGSYLICVLVSGYFGPR